jgi:tryptophan synthase alpha chain
MNMNRITRLFGKNKQRLLSVFATAGFPHINSTGEVLRALSDAGADMIEVGVPFSDPMADGPTIQASSAVALREGMTLATLLQQVKEVRPTLRDDLPLVLMGYLNPMYCFGIERLFKECKEVGIDALIIPDLPFDEYLEKFQSLCRQYNLPMIMLITPETEEERIRLIDRECDGFIYMVSSASTTGTRDKFDTAQTDYFRRIADMQLTHPRMIGFGVSNPATFDMACTYASGAIVGSLFIKCLEKNPEPKAAVAMLKTALGL